MKCVSCPVARFNFLLIPRVASELIHSLTRPVVEPLCQACVIDVYGTVSGMRIGRVNRSKLDLVLLYPPKIPRDLS
jgi:hypothetical protein